MAYDEWLAERIEKYFDHQKVNYRTIRMMGGLCFMVNEKMCCGLLYDKAKATDYLMARVGEDEAQKVIASKEATEMNFTGRVMKGYVYVAADELDTDDQLEYWLNKCLAFNPLAKASKKKKSQ